MDLVNRRAEDAIAVEERLIGELEETKLIAFNSLSNLIGPLLSPGTWGAFKDYPLDYWEPLETAAES
jgi:hypothetical protein